jgi:hypothetical protein
VLAAPKVYNQPMNAAFFEEWVGKCLAPTLSQGDIVVMDNLPAHNGARDPPGPSGGIGSLGEQRAH